MINRILSFFNVSRWSIRQKLAWGLGIALLVPLLLVMIVLETGTRNRDQLITEEYVMLVGQERTRYLNRSMRDATRTLNDLVNNLRYRRDIINVFEGRSDRVARQNIVDLLYDRLVQQGLYIDVRLIDTDGIAVANTITPRSNIRLEGQDLSETAGFRVARDARTLNEEQRIVIYSENGQTYLDVTQVLYYNDRSLAGFVVATLNIENVLVQHLQRFNQFIPIISYLTTEDGLVITNQDTLPIATQSRARNEVSRAIASSEGVRTYDNDNRHYSLYISDVEGTRLVLVTETEYSVALTSPVDAFFAGNGALFIALLVFMGSALMFALVYSVVTPLHTLRETLLDMSRGDFNVPIETVNRVDEIGAISQALANMREQVSEVVSDLNDQNAASVRDMRATQVVSRFAATQRDLQTLMDEVVNLVINEFTNIYHAQIFLIDSDRHYAVLRASTGEAGQKLLARGHRLAVGSVSVIGQVTNEGRLIIARDTESSNVHKRNEFLPDTRAELAIPLRVGDNIIGALDVQSRQDNSFTEDQVRILQTMADQIAISLDNARLYQESIQRLDQISETSRKQTLLAWQEHMYSQRTKALVVRAGQKRKESIDILRERALRRGTTVIGDKTADNTIPFVVPVKLRGQVLGVVEWELPEVEYNHEKVLLAEDLVNRLAISLDNARLFEQSQRATERERVVNTIATQLTGQTDIDEILQTAIREVGQALRVPEVNIRLSFGQSEGENGHSANGHHE